MMAGLEDATLDLDNFGVVPEPATLQPVWFLILSSLAVRRRRSCNARCLR